MNKASEVLKQLRSLQEALPKDMTNTLSDKKSWDQIVTRFNINDTSIIQKLEKDISKLIDTWWKKFSKDSIENNVLISFDFTDPKDKVKFTKDFEKILDKYRNVLSISKSDSFSFRSRIEDLIFGDL